MQKIVITGADGRMGRALLSAVLANPQLVLTGAVVKADSSLIGADVGELIGQGRLGIALSSDLHALLGPDTTLIDFTAPQATLAHLAAAAQHRASIVIGTTGFDVEQLETLAGYSDRLAMVYAGNYSVGVNLSLQLLRLAAGVMGPDSDIEITEAHHRHKVDAPSGTALMMGEAVADALGHPLSELAVTDRAGKIGARVPGTIGFASLRGGDIVGEHTVLFAAEGERLEITHKASSRQTFAHGALRAAQWLAQKQTPGLFNMEDVLGFR
ncbi:4-hydroxy-tetrahydrodipicolinate reductase [Reinekea sp.]|uniref:4-hydroxy-tetrahydrodipicolinate reductase n=1 Tax=Reinekea sp. TaxID=1970455 RepID=UPI002A7FD345|nr:4-hydroxy-tetrahydrodipicolinate reductase [Reinekea sp.]